MQIYIGAYVCVCACVFICIFSAILNPGKYLLLTTCHGSELQLHRLVEERPGEEKMGVSTPNFQTIWEM